MVPDMPRSPTIPKNRFWESKEAAAWPDNMKLLAAYLVATPHILPVGAGRLPIGYVSEDLGWDSKKAISTIRALGEANFLRYDEVSKWVWVVRYLLFNPFKSKTEARDAVKAVRVVGERLSFYQEFVATMHHVGVWKWGDVDYARELPVAVPGVVMPVPVRLRPPAPLVGSAPALVVDNTRSASVAQCNAQREAITRPLDDGHHGILETVEWALDLWDATCGETLGTDYARLPATTRVVADRLIEISATDDARRRDVWTEFCRKAMASDFITGRASGSFGMRFGVLMRQERFANVLQGTYDNRRPGRAKARFGGM